MSFFSGLMNKTNDNNDNVEEENEFDIVAFGQRK